MEPIDYGGPAVEPVAARRVADKVTLAAQGAHELVVGDVAAVDVGAHLVA